MAAVAIVLSLAALGLADVTLTELRFWSGDVNYFMTGHTLAIDGPDADSTHVDLLLESADINVTSADVPGSAALVDAFLFWGGSQEQPGAPLAGPYDDNITLTLPGGSVHAVTAEASHGSDGGASSFDMWLHRAEITPLMAAAGGAMIGTYTIQDYTGKIDNAATDNASVALLLVFSDPSLPDRRVIVYDGLVTVSAQSGTQIVDVLGLDLDNAPTGKLTYYAMEGDIGGTGGPEQVLVEGESGASLILSDPLNPAGNPMNQTINTTTPAQSVVIGVDIDQFDITPALAAGDSSLRVTYSGGTDKYWLSVQTVAFDNVNPISEPTGDYNQDGVVDAADYVVWRKDDGTPDGYDTWRATLAAP